MADSDKDIVITPNIGQSTEPKIEFTGYDNNTITMRVLDDGTLTWSGSAGELFSISDSLTGTLFSVNDVSGVPSLEVNSNGTVTIAEFSGNVLVGTATDNGTDKLQVNGSISASSITLTGDLIVEGTTTTIDTANLTITDNIITLNNGETAAGVTAGTAGIEVERGTLPNVSLLWDESTDEWKLTKDGTNYYNVLNKSDTAYTGFTNYLRSDADDTASGVITFTNSTHMTGIGEALYLHTDASDRGLITITEAANGSTGSETWYLGHGSNDRLYWYSYDQSAEVFTILENGNVGIGTSSPGRELTVNGDIGVKNSGRLYLWNDHNLNYIAYDKWTGSASAGMVIENQAGTGHLRFNTVSTERMRITSDGKVGIGTTNPDVNLSVYSTEQLIARFASTNAGISGVRLQGFDTSASDTVYVDWFYDAENRKYGFGEGTSSGDLAISSGLSHADIVVANGKVGVGTTNPTGLLESYGSVASNWAGRFENTSVNGFGILGITAGSDAADKVFELRTGTSNTQVLVEGDGDATFYKNVIVDAVGYGLRIRTDSNGRGLIHINKATTLSLADDTNDDVWYLGHGSGDDIFWYDQTNGRRRWQLYQSGVMQLGDYSATSNSPEIRFSNGDNNTSRISFYDNNDTEGTYFESTGKKYGGDFVFGARWNSNQPVIKIDARQFDNWDSSDSRHRNDHVRMRIGKRFSSIDSRYTLQVEGDVAADVLMPDTYENYATPHFQGDGSDGALTVSSANTVVNAYAYVTSSSVAKGASTISVDSTTGFSNGDAVIIIQMQSASNPDRVGTWELLENVTVTDSTTLTIPSRAIYKELTQTYSNNRPQAGYTSGTSNAVSSEVTQVVRIPAYTSVTVQSGASITASAWDGEKGGIVAFACSNDVIFYGTGKIDVTAKGYRGGPTISAESNRGCEGEGVLGRDGTSGTSFESWDRTDEEFGITSNQAFTNSRPGNNGGAGGYPASRSGDGGGGGSHATRGGFGTPDSASGAYEPFIISAARPGDIVGTATGERLTMGGGGGGGGDMDSYTDGDGGAGGGIVALFAHTIVDLTAESSGAVGRPNVDISGSGFGGGGAGGYVFVRAHECYVKNVNVKGADNSWNGDDSIGGGGGHGYSRIEILEASNWQNTGPEDIDYNGYIAQEGISLNANTPMIHAGQPMSLGGHNLLHASRIEGGTLYASNQIGIGTTSPSARLHVLGDTASAGGTETLIIGNTTGGTQMQFGTSENNYGWIQVDDGGTKRNLVLQAEGGNVGIGTTSPNSQLHVLSSISSAQRWERSGNIVGIDMASSASGGWGLYDYAASQYDIWMKNGDVGIGTGSMGGARLKVTNNDTFVLHLERTSGTPHLKWSNSADSGNYFNIWADYDGFKMSNRGTDNVDDYIFLYGNGSNGNVGIGTDAPAAKLHVQSSANIVSVFETTLTSEAAIELKNSQGSMYFGLDGSENFAVGTGWDLNNATYGKFTVTSSGNVGVGSITPADKLDVAGTIRISDGIPTLRLYDTSNSYGGGSQHRILFDTTGGPMGFIGVSDTSEGTIEITNDPTHSEITDNTGVYNDIKIVPDGTLRVGRQNGYTRYMSITGVTETIANFQTAYDGTGSQQVAISRLDGNWLDGSTGTDTQFGMLFNYQNNARGGLVYDHRSTERLTMWSSYGRIGLLIPNSATGSAVPGTTTMNEALTVAVGGNIGIGTTQPAGKLDIYGTNGQLFTIVDSFTGTIFSANDGSGVPSIEVLDTGIVRLAEFAGNVLVGTNTDDGSNKLQVNGGIMATADITAYASSDARLKTELQPIENALDKVNSLTGYTFNWNRAAQMNYGKDAEAREAGVIAQDVEAVLPEVVTTRDDGYRAVKYEKIVPLLIEALKEADDRIDAQQAQIDQLTELVNKLTSEK